MEIRVIQSSVGRYNLLSNDKNYTFSMAIYNENNKICEENGIKAILYYYGEADEAGDFEDPINNIETIFEKCFKYSSGIISSTDYKAQCLLFTKVYKENFYKIDGFMLNRHKEKVKKQIEDLQKELKWQTFIPEISYTVSKILNREIKNNEGSIEYYRNKNKELKEDSESYISNLKYIEKLESKIEFLRNIIKIEEILEPNEPK